MTTEFRFTRFKLRSATLALFAVLSWAYFQIESTSGAPEAKKAQIFEVEKLEPDGVPHPFSPAREAARWCTQSSEGPSVYYVTEARILEEVLLEVARNTKDRLLVPLTETETVTVILRRVFRRTDTDFTMMGSVESYDHRYFIFSPGPQDTVEVMEMNHEAYFSQDCCPTCAEKQGTPFASHR